MARVGDKEHDKYLPNLKPPLFQDHFAIFQSRNMSAGKAYSRISIDNQMTIEEQRENAEMILENPSNQKMCNFMYTVQPQTPNRPQNEKLKAVNQAMADRAESILRDSRFSRGTGDTQIKTMIAAKGVCKKTE